MEKQISGNAELIDETEMSFLTRMDRAGSSPAPFCSGSRGSDLHCPEQTETA